MYLPEIMKYCSLKISQYKTTPEKFVKKGTTHACTNNNFPKITIMKSNNIYPLQGVLRHAHSQIPRKYE